MEERVNTHDGINLLEYATQSLDALEEEMVKLTCTLDSGACVSVLPKECTMGYKITADGENRCYTTASGEEVVDEGSVKLNAQNDNYNDCQLNFRVTEPSVRKPLVSAYKTCLAGNRIVLDLEKGSYVYNKKTKQFTPVFVKDGTFQYDVWVRKPQVMTVQVGQRSGSATAAFRRQGPP